MSRGIQVPITPSVLRWAIEQSGLSETDIANRLRIDVVTLRKWRDGDIQPLLSDFRRLSKILKRPGATFLLPEPPQFNLPSVQFRHPPGIDRNTLNSMERRYLREAARLQRTLSWLIQELELEAPKIPKISVGVNPETQSTELRKVIEISEQKQVAWRNSTEALNSWRFAFERLGVFVFLIPLGRESARGFSLWDDRAPIIAVNTWWNTEARIFTLFHEYAHLLTRTSSACFGTTGRILSGADDATERWCESFSAAFLLPWSDLQRFLQVQHGWKPGVTIADLDIVRSVSRYFKVSLRASALRLINMKAADWDLYAEIPKWSDEKKPGGGGKGRKRAKIKDDQFGSRTARVFLNGVDNDLITRTDALNYLDITDADLDVYARRDTV